MDLGYHRLHNLAGVRIEARRMNTWRWPTATTCVPREELVQFVPCSSKPQFGDLALTEVVSLGANNFIENRYGCNMQIFPGTIILGVFSPRYAPDEYEGHVPEHFTEGQEVALLNRGGTIGNVVCRSTAHGVPTMVRPIAFIQDSNGRVANTRNYGKSVSSAPYIGKQNNRTLIIIAGSSMNSGKSNTAKAVTYALAACGQQVVAGKVTGQAAKRDVLLMKAAGAAEVIDFTDFGYPSTYLLSREEVTGLFWQIYNYLHEQAGPGGYIVIEIADGILQRETAFLLADPLIKAQTNRFVFACAEGLTAVAGVEMLKNQFGIEVTAISGRAASNPLTLREVADILGNIPTFDPMVMEVPQIAELMLRK